MTDLAARTYARASNLAADDAELWHLTALAEQELGDLLADLGETAEARIAYQPSAEVERKDQAGWLELFAGQPLAAIGILLQILVARGSLDFIHDSGHDGERFLFPEIHAGGVALFVANYLNWSIQGEVGCFDTAGRLN